MKYVLSALAAVILAGAVLTQPAQAACWRTDYGWHCWHPHPHWGWHRWHHDW